TALVVIALVACGAALLFSRPLVGYERGLPLAAGLVLAVLALGGQARDLWRIHPAKGGEEVSLVYERWNPISRLAVLLEQRGSWGGRPFGWGLSPAYDGPAPDRGMYINIDANAATPLVRFDGDPSRLDYLRYDVTAVAYYLKQRGRVFVIGPGGGRDVLTALNFGQVKVDAVEINPTIVDIVERVFADFTGRPYQYPGVSLTVGDARSYIARSSQRYDIIQSSLTDTWAATAGGGFVLTENLLYTREAFRDYYQHLTPDGILSISHWYRYPMPDEILRLATLARVALEAEGVKRPADHVAVVLMPRVMFGPMGVATFMMKRSPFAPQELSTLRAVSARMGFELVYAPGGGKEELFERLLATPDLQGFLASLPADMSPVTDDRPFFFLLTSRKDLSYTSLLQHLSQWNTNPISLLVSLLVLLGAAVVLFILGPLYTLRRPALRAHRREAIFLLYFLCLGLAYIMIELALMQRFVLFLGHPTYSLSVMLSTLLIASGLGSLLTNRVAEPRTASRLVLLLGLLCVSVLVYRLVLPSVLAHFLAASKGARVCLSVVFLAPLGLLMGMPFPLGIRVVRDRAQAMIPWFWGVNGAASVLGSVLAVTLAVFFGFSVALMVGLGAYAAALVVLGVHLVITCAGKRQGLRIAHPAQCRRT
ncbi:MAG TPA: hypothetical protein VM221_03695, partial [Armatimonadota bacterium]|nr:hypothetical protein [Armatimonadota bacterium]